MRWNRRSNLAGGAGRRKRRHLGKRERGGANEDGEARRRTYRDGKAEQGEGEEEEEEEPVPGRLSFLRGRGVGGRRELQS